MAEGVLQVQEKQDVRTPAETTTGGPVFLPAADIYEDAESMTVVVDMPGVDKDGVRINLERDILSLYGKVSRPEHPATGAYREYRIGDFSRSFIIPDTIDRERIDAGMTNGVLTLRLPKAEHAKPRRIEIRTS